MPFPKGTFHTSPVCFKCDRFPAEIPEYRDCWREYGASSADDMARDDGTYNPNSNTFCCTDCYVKIGAPSSRHGWKAP